ncbi:hypothetical protein Poli38472_013790 [Pythium oligandrum]|uniref:Uncharacterized protein n=1 Tax=Pythium oligandrum TaxID=41045 RepID=A0A8K1C284_PYTOL|nr:hypothetical protein Poli38472_013790 [Pythium oligandrum]|eukprot:TMW55028.1 hypothetical protein Poli38472_013790 [Pythium oligandrum]
MAAQQRNELMLSALAANRAYAEELEQTLVTLSEEEKELQRSIQALRQRMAMRRAEKAMAALGCVSSSARESNDGSESDASVFEREPESRYKRIGVVPRSFIRQKASFFHGSPVKTPVESTGSLRKRGRPAAAKNPKTALSEPIPNEDTVFLRQHSHQAFIATASKVFTPKERETVSNFARQHIGDDFEREISLETWNQITRVAKPPIHRTGFACKLRWELHDNPSLRLGAWAKEEDKRLKELATGAVDPSIVNNWTEIAKRMPLPGRPPVHCLIRYQTKLCSSNLNVKFTPEEDELLCQAVEVFGERWATIADLMDGRIAEQLRHRWHLSLSPNVKLGKFSVVEDRRLLLALYAYHDRDELFQTDNVSWQQVCHHMPGRPPPPVRDRFLNSLNPEVTFRPWTAAEDATIKETVQSNGFDSAGLWSTLAAKLGNRTDNQVARRARYLLAGEFKRFQEDKKASEEQELPAVFQRASRPRRAAGATIHHELRSSYNASAEDDSERSGTEPEDAEVQTFVI